MRADLHTHSYYSDGQLSPEDIADMCVKNGVGLCALTDHDNMNGCAEFERACRERDVKSVRGLEISAYTEVKVHILGYNLDCSCDEYKKFEKFVCEGSVNRTADILSKLKKRGISLTFDDVLRERKCSLSPRAYNVCGTRRRAQGLFFLALCVLRRDARPWQTCLFGGGQTFARVRA